jgi:uncharacterized membrane protein YfcA
MSDSAKSKTNYGLVLLGFIVAFFSAGIGIGGGTILVSSLMSVFKFDFKKAASISLSTIIPISFIGSISYFILLSNSPPLGYYFLLIPMSVLGAVIGGRFVLRWKGSWLKLAFSFFLIVASLRILKIIDFPSLFYYFISGISYVNEILIVVIFGLLVGFVAVMLGVGCGLVIVPFSVIFLGFEIHEAIRLSLTTMFFLTFSATLVHKKLKNLNTTALRSMFVPALIGAVTGAVISSHLPAPIITKVFGVFLLLIACKFIVQEISAYKKQETKL